MVAREPQHGSGSAVSVPRPSVRVPLIAVLLALVLATLDNLILSTAMPVIVGELGGLDYLSWVVTSYALATAVTTPIWGKLGDMHGRRGVFLAAIVIFMAGSVLAGASPSMAFLIGSRAVQGIGAGGLMVGAFSIIAELVHPREAARYQGMISAVMGTALISGPLLGGLITDHLGWRWGFFVNLPLGAIALVLVTTALKLPKRKADGRLDFLGAALLVAVISALVLITTWGGTKHDWGSWLILGLAAVAVLGTVAFVAVERRARQPVLPLAIFRNANFSLITVISFLFGFTQLGALTFLPIFLQAVQGATATSSGLLLLPVFVALVSVNVVGGRVISRGGRYKVLVIAGCVLVPAGMFLFSLMGPETGPVTAALPMAAFGAGMGLLMQTTMLISQESVERSDVGVASSTATLVRSIGGSFGVSVMGALFARTAQDVMVARGDAGQLFENGARLDAAGLDRLPATVRAAYEHAVATGAHRVFLLGAAIGAILFLLAWFINETPLRGMNDPH